MNHGAGHLGILAARLLPEVGAGDPQTGPGIRTSVISFKITAQCPLPPQYEEPVVIVLVKHQRRNRQQ